MLEIERKFLMEGFPRQLELLREVEIEQGYISTEPEVRLHRATDINTGKSDFRLTVKGEGELTRTEIKTDIDEGFFYDAVDFTGVNFIMKDYKSYKLGPWVLEVSHVDPGSNHSFYYGEIEFMTEEDAKEFIPPNYLGREITFNEDYKMKNYWKRTRG